ncbi:hypothetical protein MCNF_39710 [Mycolicibacterium confluentis]|uniref:Uncharacterized protein n=1 Tax=Mycolicibacterium confluentis TaxID=28047 RepID=A0A7I7Y175_9MYCO|nr:hypothetical protein MCNF_39710 [Mycolicibacterium confluentis]
MRVPVGRLSGGRIPAIARESVRRRRGFTTLHSNSRTCQPPWSLPTPQLSPSQASCARAPGSLVRGRRRRQSTAPAPVIRTVRTPSHPDGSLAVGVGAIGT